MTLDDYCTQHYQNVYRRILFLLRGNPETAMELTQETFVKFVRAFPGLTHHKQVSSYLWRIATNVVYDYWRSGLRHVEAINLEEINDKLIDAEQMDPYDLCDRADFSEATRLAWQLLPVEYQRVLVLRMEHKPAEIASMLDRPVGEIYRLVKTAQESFKRRYVYERTGAA